MTVMRFFSTVEFLEIFSLRRRVFQWLEAPAVDSNCLRSNLGSTVLLHKEVTWRKFPISGNLSFFICKMDLLCSSLGELEEKR